MNIRLIRFLAMFLGALVSAGLRAQIIFATDNNSGNASLYSVNPTTGAATLIGATGFGRVSAIAFSPSGVLYGIAGNSGDLITINTTTGVGTSVGNTGITATDMSFTSGGVLYAQSFNSLYQINPTTGSPSFIGNGSGGNGNAIAVNTSGTLYFSYGNGTMHLFTLSTTTGASTLVADNTNWNTGVNGGNPRPSAMTFDPVTGTLWATVISDNGTFVSTMNPVNANVTIVGSAGVTLDGIAISPIPEPSTYAVIVGSGALGLAVLRRRKRA